LKALCKLLSLRGSRGKHTQLLVPSPSLSTQGRASLRPGGGKPAASGGGRKNHTQLEVLPANISAAVGVCLLNVPHAILNVRKDLKIIFP